MYERYREADLGEVQAQAERSMGYVHSHFSGELGQISAQYSAGILSQDAALARSEQLEAACASHLADLDARLGQQLAAIHAEYDHKEAEYTRAMALPMTSGAGLIPQSLATPYAPAQPAEEWQADESPPSLFAQLVSWIW